MSERERYRRMCDAEMKSLQQEIWVNKNLVSDFVKIIRVEEKIRPKQE